MSKQKKNNEPAAETPQQTAQEPETELEPVEEKAAPSELEQAQAALELAKADLAAEHDKLLRLAAEFDNYRSRTTREKERIYADAKAEYLALPAEKRTTTQLAKMAKGYLSRANALEKECDGKMDEVIRAMETLIRDNNGDLTLVDTVVYTYANEKSLKKSWYMAKLEQKGLL